MGMGMGESCTHRPFDHRAVCARVEPVGTTPRGMGADADDRISVSVWATASACMMSHSGFRVTFEALRAFLIPPMIYTCVTSHPAITWRLAIFTRP